MHKGYVLGAIRTFFCVFASPEKSALFQRYFCYFRVSAFWRAAEARREAAKADEARGEKELQLSQMMAQMTMQMLDSSVLSLLVEALHAQVLHDVQLPSLEDCLEACNQQKKNGRKSGKEKISTLPTKILPKKNIMY